MQIFDHNLIFNLGLVIGFADHRTETCGFSDDGQTSSVLRAAFVTWLVACEEARAQTRTGAKNANFVKHVIDVLPEYDDPNWGVIMDEGFHSSLRDRMKCLWGIRIAFTHSDGDLSTINNAKYREWAINSEKYLIGVKVIGNRIDMAGSDLRYITESFRQLGVICK